MERLRAAIRARRRLEIVYADAAGQPSRRVVWPVQIGFMDSVRVLAAGCELREAFRTFHTDRILEAIEGLYCPASRSELIRGLREQLAPSDCITFVFTSIDRRRTLYRRARRERCSTCGTSDT
ncbi:WYL domain-containing protein [Paraburkholderia sp. GAS348]|uniref:WYL domain-containing protein n=1 Tax=Paraburkholderia sp. GAS348 TaxID=3035132 RepID=UPI003D1AEFDB